MTRGPALATLILLFFALLALYGFIAYIYPAVVACVNTPLEPVCRESLAYGALVILVVLLGLVLAAWISLYLAEKHGQLGPNPHGYVG